MNIELLKLGWNCKCPRCEKGNLYKPGLTLSLRECCNNCGLDLSKNDSADGPAVFLIFILGFLLVPLALLTDAIFTPPLWLHLVVWTPFALGLTLGLLRPLKAYIIALQFRHRPGDWE
jgi:uncharacterized protein (DUF983 family)